MKKLFVLLMALITLNVFASSHYTATVDETFCGEMDPFEIGDVCVLHLTKKSGQKVAILINFDDFIDTYTEEGELDGLTVNIDTRTLSEIDNPNVISILKRFDDRYSYVAGELDSFEVLENLSPDEMERFISKLNSNFYVSNLPYGYKAKKVESLIIKENFKNYLSGLTAGKLSQWKDYVYSSGEYDDVSFEEQTEIAQNPLKEIRVKELLEIDVVYEIYRDGKLIGFYVEVSDHVQAAIYQDGAWIEMFLDTNQNVRKYTNESA